jgi:hypothetical protein
VNVTIAGSSHLLRPYITFLPAGVLIIKIYEYPSVISVVEFLIRVRGYLKMLHEIKQVTVGTIVIPRDGLGGIASVLNA